MERISLANVGSDYRTAAEEQQIASQARKASMEVQELDRAKKQRFILDAAIKRHAQQDPTTGQVAVDHDGVVADLYKEDPELAQSYETDVLNRHKTAVDVKATEEKTEAEKYTRTIKAVGDALSGVDEDGDQDVARASYESAVARLKASGFPVAKEDEIYSPGRVKYWKNQMVGATEQFKAKETRAKTAAEQDGQNQRAVLSSNTTLAARQNADSAAMDRVRVQQAGANGRTVATINARNNGASGGGGGGGGGRITKQGEITLRTDPAFKQMAGVNYEQGVADLDNVIDLIQSGKADTGPGRGARNFFDRAGMAADSLLGDASPARFFGRRFAANGAEDRVTSHDVVERVSTKAAIDALQLVGGNDSDKDFNRAINTTVGNLKTGKYNIATATMQREFMKLGQKKKDFYIKWANANGSPLATDANGTTVAEAWRTASAGEQSRVVALSRQLYAAKPPAKTAPKAPPKPPAGARTVVNKDGSFWFQNLKTGALTRAK